MTRKRLSRIIRLFISSTFIDMERERLLLHARVFPAITKLCEARDWRFETIDLRWGITAEEANDNRTIEICVNEIRHSRQISPRPNFIILGGQRYGWIPIPNRLPKDIFQAIIQEVSAADGRVLQRMYIQDENSVDLEYILKKSAEKSNEAGECRRIFEKYGLTHPEFQTAYLISATESEIYEGLFREPDLKENVSLYVRHLTDIPTEEVEIYCQNESRQLELNSRLRKYVSQEDTIFLDTSFSRYSRGDDDDLFVTEMTALLSRQVLDEMDRHSQLDFDSEELLIQGEECKQRAKKYPALCGSDDIVFDALKHSRIIVINGNPGNDSGAMAAHIAQSLPNAIIRYAGIGSRSDSSDAILRSIFYEISGKLPENENGTALYRELKHLLSLCSEPWTIIIANIDRLSDRDVLLGQLWLPLAFKAPNIKVVFVAENESLDFAHIKNSTIVDLPLTEPEMVRSVVYDSLYRNGRQLNENQICDADKLIAQTCSGLPQNIDLLVQNLQQLQCGEKVDTSLIYPASFWKEMCSGRNNDPLFAKLALALINTIPGGVTDNEILEILATDNELYTSLIEAHNHRIVTGGTTAALPMSMWSKLYFQLVPVLSAAAGRSASKNHIAYPSAANSLSEFLGRETCEHVLRLAKDYFMNPTRYESYRATELLPAIMQLLGDHDTAAGLLCDDSFCNRKIGLGMLRGLKDDLISAISVTPLPILKDRLDFLNSEEPTLIKYCRVSPRFFKRHFSNYAIENKVEIGQYKVQRRRLFRLIGNYVIAAGGNRLLVVENDEKTAECTLYDIATMKPTHSIDIALEECKIIRGGKTVDRFFSTIKEAVVSNDGQIVGMTCSMGRALKWRVDTNEVEFFAVEPDNFGDAFCSSPVVAKDKIAYSVRNSNTGESLRLDNQVLFHDPSYPGFEYLYVSADDAVLYAVNSHYLEYLNVNLSDHEIKKINLKDSTLKDWTKHLGYDKAIDTLFYRGQDQFFPIGAMDLKNKTTGACTGEYKPTEYIFNVWSSTSLNLLVMAQNSKLILMNCKTHEICGEVHSGDSGNVRLMPLDADSFLCIGKDITLFSISTL